uniref:hypothetical protein RF1 n=1 Tax=Myosurus apetalus TaxID=2071495 RepID=UPI0030E028B8
MDISIFLTKTQRRTLLMILKYLILGDPIALCMKIMNSVVVAGLYYGLLSTLSIGPSYLFLLQARVMEEGKLTHVSATTGFIMGHLIMFISIYYAPLHLALSRPHTITVLVLPYIVFQFFWYNHKYDFDLLGVTLPNSMRNLHLPCVFLNNFIFQLLNLYILPSATLARLVHVYMFRYNNKMLFVTSSFVGWLIGHIFFMKGLGLVLFWIRNSIGSDKKYILAEVRESMARSFSILLFLTCIFYFGAMPYPLLTGKMIEEKSKKKENEEETDVEREATYETKGTKQEQEGSTKKPYPTFDYPTFASDSEDWADLDKIDEKPKDEHLEAEFNFLDGNPEDQIEIEVDFCFEKTLVTHLFDYNRRYRPLRYIKNNRVENAIRDELSQLFFSTCQSDGKQKISFTYPPSVSAFLELIQLKMPLCMTEERSSEESYNNWVSTNDEKRKNISKELVNRIGVLDKGFLVMDILEKRTRLCNGENEQECLPNIYDPLLNGPYRGTIKNFNSGLSLNKDLIPSIEDPTIKEEEDAKDLFFGINKLEDILCFNDYTEFINESNYLGIKPKIYYINKKVFKWSYNLIYEGDIANSEELAEEIPQAHFRARKPKPMVILQKEDLGRPNALKLSQDEDEEETKKDISWPRYPEKSYFARDLIKGATRNERRKVGIWKLFQSSIHSPLFVDRIDRKYPFSIEIEQMLDFIFRKWMGGDMESKILYSEEQETNEEEKRNEDEQETKEEDKRSRELERRRMAEMLENAIAIQIVRGLALVIQSTLRKNIILPSLILAKNIGRMLLFQPSEWQEDWKDWSREIHVNCTYNGVPFSETEFPAFWLTKGIQIKILLPFRIKPWRVSKRQSQDSTTNKGKPPKSCFLTAWGLETDRPLGYPRKRASFFKPIWKHLVKKLKKAEMKRLKNKTSITLSGLKEVSESNSNGKKTENLIRKNTIPESSIQIGSTEWTNYSLTEHKMKDIAERTNKIRNQIRELKKDKQNLFTTADISIDPNEISWDDKKSKTFWQIVNRLIRKCHCFWKIYLEKIYINIFLRIINILERYVEISLELKKIIAKYKYSYNEIKKKKRMEERNNNPFRFISTINNINKQGSISNTTTSSNPNSPIFYDLSSLSQAYVFYQLSQSQAINKHYLKSLFQYSGRNPFIKENIKNLFGRQGIFDSESRHQNSRYFGMNEWKRWLMGNDHYQYNLSRTSWSELMPQKWRTKINKNLSVQKENSTHFDLYQKEPLIHYEKQTDFAVNSVPSLREKLLKNYKYDLLSNKYINYTTKTSSSFYGLPNNSVGVCNNSILYNPQNLVAEIDLRKYPPRADSHIDPNLYRKYFDWGTLDFCPTKVGKIAEWLDKDLESFGKFRMDTYRTLYQWVKMKIAKREVNFWNLRIRKQPPPPNQTKPFWDWMGMNEELLNWPRSNKDLWFFQELLFLNEVYKMKPWILPINSLLDLVPSNAGKKSFEKLQSKEKKISEKKISEEKILEEKIPEEKIPEEKILEEKIPEKKIPEEKIPEDGTKKKSKKKKKKKTALELFLERIPLYQLRWEDSFYEKMLNNVKMYCLLFKLNSKNPEIIVLSSIQREELILESLVPRAKGYKGLLKTGGFLIEPLRLSTKWDGKFIMYQTIVVSQVQKMKDRARKKKTNLAKKQYKFLVPENILSPRRRRELRILICLNSKKLKVGDQNQVFFNKNSTSNSYLLFSENKNLDVDTKNFLKFKFFLWPNYRLEDLACMNRYWFDTNNGSRFSMSRIRMYP